MPPNNRQIDALIHDLSQVKLSADAFNEYAPGDANNAIRRENLRCYLRTMAERNPATLLVMEAPGYRGCRLTGVPVTSRKVLLEGVPRLKMFGPDAGYRDVDDMRLRAGLWRAIRHYRLGHSRESELTALHLEYLPLSSPQAGAATEQSKTAQI